jgi:hypothetical protein
MIMVGMIASRIGGDGGGIRMRKTEEKEITIFHCTFLSDRILV